MENCKYCNQELPEECTVCPHCGKPLNETEETKVPVQAEETEAPVQAEEAAAPEAEEKAEPRKVTPGRIALAVGAAVVLLAVLAFLIWTGVKGSKPAEPAQPTQAPEETVVSTIPADGDPGNATCKGSYTVSDAEAQALRNEVVATIGSSQLTNGLLQVHYWTAVNSFLNSQQGYYVMMYGGLDYSRPLDTQRCVVDENLTWQQYFLTQALSNWQTSCALAAEAEKAGVEMSEEERAFLDNMDNYLTETAESNGMSVEELLLKNIGPGAGKEEFIQFQEQFSKGRGYYTQKVADIVPTDAELEAFYNAHAAEYESGGMNQVDKFVNVRHILVMLKGSTETSEDGTPIYTDEHWSACEAEAQSILDSWLAGEKTEESFAALANEKSEDPGSNTSGGLYENVAKGQMVAPFEAWCFDEARQPGDYGLVRTEYGYHIMYYVEGTPQWQYYAKNDWTTDQLNQLFESLAEAYPMEADYSKIALGYLELG